MEGKVLIFGPDFFGYNQSIRRAFEQSGYAAQVVAYDEPVHPFDWKNKWLHKLFPDSKRLRARSRRTFNAQALEAFDAYRPDLVFIYNGDILEKETIRYFRRTSRVAVWMLDGAFLHPDSLAIAPETDVYFCFERSDVAPLRAQGVNAYFLPQGYDPAVYYPVPSENPEKDIDILFVGALYRYPERIRLMKLLVRTFGDRYKMLVYGWYKPWYKTPLRWLFRERRDIYMNRSIPSDRVNRLYNRARVCLNIHHEQSADGANPKVFEICGSGAYQVVDYNPFVAEVYPHGEVGIFRSDEELLAEVERALNNDCSGPAARAHRQVAAHHTFGCRIREALRILGMSVPGE